MTKTPTQAEHLAAALIVLAEAGISPDIQELLVHGKPGRRIPPGALAKVLARHAEQARLEERERCARIAEEERRGLINTWHQSACTRIATAIRKGEAA